MQVFVIFSMIVCCGPSTATASRSPKAMPRRRPRQVFLKGIARDDVRGRRVQQGRRDPGASSSSRSRRRSRRSPCCLIVGAFAERMKFSRGAALRGALVHVRATCRSRTWSGSGRARRVHGKGRRDQRQGRPDLAVGSARLRRRHGRAHQRRRRRPGRRVPDRQARRLRQRRVDAAHPDADDGRRVAALGRLVRLQRRLGARSRRHRGAGLHQHALGDRRRGARVVLAEAIFKGKASMLGAASGAVAGLVAITPACRLRRPDGRARDRRPRRPRLPLGRQRAEAACSATTTRSTSSACTASAASSARC